MKTSVPSWWLRIQVYSRRIFTFSLFKDFFLNLSLNKKLISMMLFLSFILLSILLDPAWQSEQLLIHEFEKQTAELSKAIQVGVERVTASKVTSESGLEQYMKWDSRNKQIGCSTEEVIASSNPD